MLGSRSPAARYLGGGRTVWNTVRRFVGTLFFLLAGWHVSAQALLAAGIDELRDHYVRGRYENCIREAAEAIRDSRYGEEWRVYKAAAELATGKYRAAHKTTEQALKLYSSSVRLRLLAHQALLHTGVEEQAGQRLEEIAQLAQRSPWRYTDADDLVAIGEAALLAGADARVVLESLFDRAKRDFPRHRAPYIAAGRLALDKHDAPLAAEIFDEAAKLFAEDPDVQFGLAVALAEANPERAQAALERCLQQNPRHIDALLLQAGGAIDSERYAEALTWLDRVFAVNPYCPRGWAFRAVLAHLQNDPRGESIFRARALSTWPRNPEVDHLIGKKFSQKYRFTEGAAAQRRALEFDSRFAPAQIQLSQDLLRLGIEHEGWQLAEAAHSADGYDVVTFNLLELRDQLARFRTLETDDFIVRMDAHEANVYGDQVLKLLSRAKRILCEKYGLPLTEKVTVEIFPNPDDFAVRTFGMPAVSGYLGVCFGRVITANSPASQAENPSNWESVLWHEFCHVVTLELTRNKMPRWLSEGISVYEELQANPAWGQRMNPQYREMVLNGELTSIGQLSSAFLSPKSALHVQFAYYESALVVEYLVKHHGHHTLQRILADLRDGLPINVVLERQTGGMADLEAGFAAFVRHRAESIAPKADWSRPELPALLNDDGEELAEFLKSHPHNFAALSAQADVLLKDGRWREAMEPLQTLIDLYPGYTGGDNAYERLAWAYRELKETQRERQVLETYAALDADALQAYLRLLTLQSEAEDWPAILKTCRRILAVNPMLEQSYRSIAEAAEALGETEIALTALRTQLLLAPRDPARVHYQLARLLYERGDSEAKRHVLIALEESPRFQAAHRLLLTIHEHEQPSVAVRPANFEETPRRR